MRVLAVDPEERERPEGVEAIWGMEWFYELLSASDVVCVCAPLTPETEGLFDRRAFRAMRRHAYLINVTRGGIVGEEALLEALRDGVIGGAGLDVTPQEPLPDAHPLWTMPNVVITPHVAGASQFRLDRGVDLFCENLKRFLKGGPLLAVIDKRKGY
ncbi:MAG: D-2-hydroxyacid dehydrogenase, partial [Candidatus Latescibacteria bacterium]|nr:D-2-hydroxyacid dehydrogenase [Candidatus Latescibacterota bacterium]